MTLLMSFFFIIVYVVPSFIYEALCSQGMVGAFAAAGWAGHHDSLPRPTEVTHMKIQMYATKRYRMDENTC